MKNPPVYLDVGCGMWYEQQNNTTEPARVRMPKHPGRMVLLTAQNWTFNLKWSSGEQLPWTETSEKDTRSPGLSNKLYVELVG